jgi:hypothetical protein
VSNSDNEAPALLSAQDADLEGVIPADVLRRYEVLSYRNAARILANAIPKEFDELMATLSDFRIDTIEMVTPGGNKSLIAKKMEGLLNPLGWNETRIRADLHVETGAKELNPAFGTKRSEKQFRSVQRRYIIPNIIDGHKIDFVKGRVAFDMEWNSKDQTFDRDLYAMRAFYDAGIISAGVLLTRDATLKPLFTEIGSRVTIEKFKSKYGASTTWMGKLTYRLDAGRAGGCPILAIGIKPEVVEDFDEWKGRNPVIRKAIDLGDVSEPAADEDDE